MQQLVTYLLGLAGLQCYWHLFLSVMFRWSRYAHPASDSYSFRIQAENFFSSSKVALDFIALANWLITCMLSGVYPLVESILSKEGLSRNAPGFPEDTTKTVFITGHTLGIIISEGVIVNSLSLFFALALALRYIFITALCVLTRPELQTGHSVTVLLVLQNISKQLVHCLWVSDIK